MRSLLLLGLLATSLAVPMRALACGGFFCSSSPVDQAGERVVYAREIDGSLTMAVEIQYAGFDDDFAWIIPVPAPPEISLGTSALFDELDRATRPTFVYEQRIEGTCRDYPRCVRSDGTEPVGGVCSDDTSVRPPTYVDTMPEPPPDPVLDDGTITDGGVTVFSEAPVGPYETVVLGATTAAEVVEWLSVRGYDIPSSSLPLLEPYAALGNVFVALRLSADRASSALRPIVLRSSAGEACLPIRLTAIATVPELPITAFFLGASPVVARNYSSAIVDVDNPALYTGLERWSDAVAAEVDRLDGHAFSTDYSGRTPLLALALPSVNDLGGEDDPQRFLGSLVERGYQGDALLLEVLERHLLPPPGLDAGSYYNCLLGQGASACGTASGFDPHGLAATIEAEITRPRAEADALVRRQPRLSRLFTTLSPEEMTIDPVFVEDDGAPDIANVHRAVLVTHCGEEHYLGEAPQDLVIGEGTALDLRAGGHAVPVREAVRADDVAYCRRFGAVVADEDATSTVRRCGYARGCSVHGDALPDAGLVVLLFGVWFLRPGRARR